jgi:hypothetical protein
MKLIKIALAMAVLMAPAASLGKQARTLDELVSMYDSTGCKACHAEIYAQWEASHHARPLMGVGGNIFLIPVLRSSPFAPRDPAKATKENFPCFKCHLPHALDAAQPVFAEIAKAVLANDKKTLGRLQITCLVCHNKTAILHRLELGQPEENVIYATRDIKAHPDKQYKTVKKSAVMGQPVACGQCHGTGPNLDMENPYQCATLYGSYLHAYVPGGGARTCQECHMEKGSHSFPPDMNDVKATSAFLKKHIRLEVEALGYEFLVKKGVHAPMVVLTTRVSTAAGHRTPDG